MVEQLKKMCIRDRANTADYFIKNGNLEYPGGTYSSDVHNPYGSNNVEMCIRDSYAQADAVREALFAAGCGNIGDYDSCSYNLKGEGTFRAKEGTQMCIRDR